MRIAVILNPAADRGRAAQKLDAIAQGLEARGISFEIFRTDAPGHATEITRELLEADLDAVAAAGGDGTLNEVAQALVGTGVPLGVIPCGSGNDFIRAVGIPRDLEGALDAIARGRAKIVDVGLVDAVEAGRRFFLNSFGAGIDGQIALDYKRMRYLKGELGYLGAAVLEVFRFRGFRARVRADGIEHEAILAFLPLQNGPYTGGGFHVAPGAAPDDGYLDMVLVEDRSVIKRIPLLKRFRDGTYLGSPGIKRLQVREVDIELGRPLVAHMDGEILPRPVAHLKVEVLPGALRVLT